jgi:hypothetical protein
MRAPFRAYARNVDVERMMNRLLFAAPALLVAGTAAAQGADRPNPLDAKALSPAVEYRSAFEGYRPFAETDKLRDWRQANEEVREAGGHAGHKPGQGAGQPAAKPQPEAPQSSGHGAHK